MVLGSDIFQARPHKPMLTVKDFPGIIEGGLHSVKLYCNTQASPRILTGCFEMASQHTLNLHTRGHYRALAKAQDRQRRISNHVLDQGSFGPRDIVRNKTCRHRRITGGIVSTFSIDSRTPDGLVRQRAAMLML